VASVDVVGVALHCEGRPGRGADSSGLRIDSARGDDWFFSGDNRDGSSGGEFCGGHVGSLCGGDSSAP